MGWKIICDLKGPKGDQGNPGTDGKDGQTPEIASITTAEIDAMFS